MDVNLIKPEAYQKQQRNPKYMRTNDVCLRLQERDLKIIQLVHERRFLSSDLVAALMPGSRQGILRRLCLLFHAGYLDRPREQVKPFQPGSGPMVYALGNRGADLLHDVLGIPRERVDWTSKNREAKNVFLNHSLIISSFWASLKLACARHGGIELIDQERIVQGEPVLKISMSREFKGKVQNLCYDLVPDALFGLHFLEEAPDRNRAFYLLEADRATMPIVRSNFFRSAFFKKLLGYKHCKITGAFKQTFGFENPRILACRGMYEDGKASGMFLFSLMSNFTLSNVDNILKPIWRNARDERLASLVD
jgi:hypothetical protein